MTEQEKVDLKKEMISKRDELVLMIAQLKEDSKPMGLDDAIGRVSRMDYINNKSVNESRIRKSEEDVKALEHWLDIFDTEHFGKCHRCGTPINPKRLLFMPASSRCVRCAV